VHSGEAKNTNFIVFGFVQLKTTGVINAEVAGYILKGDRPNQLSFNLVEWFQRRQVSGFLRVFWFPPPVKLTATI
jgi:hypothetical protein